MVEMNLDDASMDGETYWDRVYDAIKAAEDSSRAPADRVTWLTTGGKRTAAIVPPEAAGDYLDNPPVFAEGGRIQRRSGYRDVLAEAAAHPGRIVITCTLHGVTDCPCLTAPGGGSALRSPATPTASSPG
jgi:hypothetical protein